MTKYDSFLETLKSQRNRFIELRGETKAFDQIKQPFLEATISSIDKSIEEIEFCKSHYIWDRLVIAFFGQTNAGKSTFLNGLLDMLEEENRHIAVSEMPDTTLDFIEIKLSIGTIYDSQGFSYRYLDTEDALIRLANNKKEIKPVTYQMKENESLILENLIRINSNKKNSITFFGSANLKLQKVYENNIRLKNSYKIVLDVPNNSQLVLKGIGFFYIKQACELTIYGLEKYALEVIPSFMGGG